MWTLDGRYRLEHRIGAGGMSVVWRGYDQVLNRPVAVKLLRTGVLMGRVAHQRVHAEAQAAARLTHPSVAAVYDFGRCRLGRQWVSYLVMELLDGETLAVRLRRGPLDWSAAARVCAEIAAGLSASHARGIVHRDVKPANVILTVTGAKVVDFGIAAAVGQPEALGRGQLLGTPAYVAPERLRGEVAVPGTDVYGLGLLLYHCLTGQLPWRAGSAAELIEAHLGVAPEPLPVLAGMPSEIGELCLACLRKSPADRPTASQVALTLACAAGLPAALGSMAALGNDSVGAWRLAVPGSGDPEADTVFQDGPTPGTFPPGGSPGRPRATAASTRALRASILASLVAAGVLTSTAASVPEPARAPATRSVALGPGPARTPDPQRSVAAVAASCRAGYMIVGGWADRTTATVTVTSRPDDLARGWTLTFLLPPDRYLAAVDGADWSQSGREVTMRGGYSVTAGTELMVTFAVSGSGSGDPGSFALNGMVCGTAVSNPIGVAVRDGDSVARNPRDVTRVDTSPSPSESATSPPGGASASPTPICTRSGNGSPEKLGVTDPRDPARRKPRPGVRQVRDRPR